jgi:hypothetical protein
MTPRPFPGRKQPNSPFRTKSPTVRTDTPRRSATSSTVNGPCSGGLAWSSFRQSASIPKRAETHPFCSGGVVGGAVGGKGGPRGAEGKR